jgi:hypothetical protein
VEKGKELGVGYFLPFTSTLTEIVYPLNIGIESAIKWPFGGIV